MNPYKINKASLYEVPAKTTPTNVKEANEGLFRAKMTLPAAVLVIAKYQYQCAFVDDQEINLLAALTEIMVECEFL